jgi:hypothetical protein
VGRGYTVLICVLCMALAASAAVPDSLWAARYGGNSHDVCNAVVPTSDGGYALAGWTKSSGAGWYDFWLVKTDASGNKQWDKTYGGPEGEGAFAIQQTPVDGGYILAGVTGSFGDGPSDIWLVKTDADGNELWNHRYGGPQNEGCYSVQLSDDGGYVLGGFTDSYGFGGRDFWLLKTNSNGDSLWSRAYGASGFDQCNSMIKTTDGGFALAGVTESFRDRDQNYWLIKTDANGDSLWTRVYGTAEDDICYSLAETPDGGFVLGGSTMKADTLDNMVEDFFLVRVKANGDSAWSHTYGTAMGREICYSIQVAQDSSFVLAGAKDSVNTGLWDAWFMKADPLGNLVYQRSFGGPERDICTALAKSPDGGFLLGGYTRSFGASFEDFWAVKTGADVLINPPGNFSLISPPADTTFGADFYHPVFTWQTSANPDIYYDTLSYRVFICDDSLFADPAITDTSQAIRGTSFTWSRVLVANQPHYWRVLASDKGGWSTWSTETRKFTITGTPPSTFDLVSPDDNAMIPDSFTLTFHWNAPTDADPGDSPSYMLFLSTDSAFGTADSVSSVGTTKLWPEVITANQRTFWRVRATDLHGLSSWSSTSRSFTISAYAPVWNGASLVSPANGDTVLDNEIFDLVWNAATDSDAVGDTLRYTVYVSADSFATSDSLDIPLADGARIRWPQVLPAPHRYWWKVKAYDKHNLFAWSDTWYFDRVLHDQVPGRPESIEPPTVFKVHQNYPNPFNAVTEIAYDLPNAGMVTIKVFNVLGRQVETLVNQNMPAGRWRTTFDATNLPSGIYIVRVEAPGVSDLKKMILLK